MVFSGRTALELGPRCAARLRERALLIDSERLERLTLARLTYSLASGSTAPTSEDIAGGIDRAIDQILREDGEDDDRGLVPEESADSPYRFLTLGLAIDHPLALAAAVRFNGQPDRIRRVFFELVLERRSIAECLALGLGPLDRMKDEMRAAVDALYRLPAPQRNGREGDGRP